MAMLAAAFRGTRLLRQAAPPTSSMATEGGMDWDVLDQLMHTPEGKRELSRLRVAIQEVGNTLETKFVDKAPTINWDFYKEKLGPSIVNIFQKTYEGFKPPKYEDKLTPEFQKQMNEYVEQAGEIEEHVKKELVIIKEELRKMREKEEKLASLTVDEVFAERPDLKEQIDDEIRNHNWGY